jgi:hypothetical protein
MRVITETQELYEQAVLDAMAAIRVDDLEEVVNQSDYYTSSVMEDAARAELTRRVAELIEEQS